MINSIHSTIAINIFIHGSQTVNANRVSFRNLDFLLKYAWLDAREVLPFHLETLTGVWVTCPVHTKIARVVFFEVDFFLSPPILFHLCFTENKEQQLCCKGRKVR